MSRRPTCALVLIAALLAFAQLVANVAAGAHSPATKIWFTDFAGNRIDHASYGQPVRIVTNRGHVCIRTTAEGTGNYCSHFTPRVLRRTVNPHIVFSGRIRATSYDPRSPFSHPTVLARASLPVWGR